MDVSLILKIIGVGMIIAVSHQILQRSGRDEQALLLSVAGILFVLVIVVDEMYDLFSQIRTVFGI